jgi:hypothetical protein
MTSESNRLAIAFTAGTTATFLSEKSTGNKMRWNVIMLDLLGAANASMRYQVRNRIHQQQVLNVTDSGRCPGRLFGFLALHPTQNVTRKDHMVPANFYANAMCFQLGVSTERSLDTLFDGCSVGMGLDDDVVVDVSYASQISDTLVRGLALVLPVHPTFERDPSLVDPDLYLVFRQESVPSDRIHGGSSNLFIASLAC